MFIILTYIPTEPEGIIEIRGKFTFSEACIGSNLGDLIVRRDKLLSLMERLDSQYAGYKHASKDITKTAEERAAAAEQLAARETFLQPSYKQLALLYADLHE